MSRVVANSSPAGMEPELPASGVRTTISFLLFVHMFLLGGAVLGNLNVRSPLMAKLVSTPGIRQYLSFLNLNTAFQFALTEERDHQVMISLDVPQQSKPAATDSDAEPRMSPAQLSAYKNVELMPQPVSPGIRRRRYLKLGQLLAQSNDEAMSFLAVALANGLLNENQIAPPTEPPQNKGEKREHHLICFEHLAVPLIPSGPDPTEQRTTVFDRTVYPAGNQWGVTQPVAKGEASGTAGGARRQPPRPPGQAKPAPQPPASPATNPANQGT